MAQTKLMWSNLGPIRADMALDHVPKQAGVYKLTFKLWGNTYTYIGEAGARGLRARIGDYANHPPAEGNKAEHLLHDLLQKAGEADLSVCCTGVTLDEQKARRKFEKEAVVATQQERLMCLNTGGYSVDVRMRRFVLESEEKMLSGIWNAFAQSWLSFEMAGKLYVHHGVCYNLPQRRGSWDLPD